MKSFAREAFSLNPFDFILFLGIYIEIFPQNLKIYFQVFDAVFRWKVLLKARLNDYRISP